MTLLEIMWSAVAVIALAIFSGVLCRPCRTCRTKDDRIRRLQDFIRLAEENKKPEPTETETGRHARAIGLLVEMSYDVDLMLYGMPDLSATIQADERLREVREFLKGE